ncbi:MAG: NUDIX hydrolase [Patescibacteria group bacterium]
MTDGIRQLDILDEEAKELFFKKESDEFSLHDFMEFNGIALLSARRNKRLTADDLKNLCGHDASIPKNEKVRCALCLADLILGEAKLRYPDDEKIQWLIKHYDALDDVLSGRSMNKPSTGLIVELQDEIDATVGSWPVAELENIQKKFIAIKNEILAADSDSSEMIPRFYVKIQARDEDEDRGEIMEKNGKPQYSGSFVLAKADAKNCFKKAVFALGLDPGFHILSGCGNAGKYYSHLYQLRNFRFELSKDSANAAQFRHWWSLLPPMIYRYALEKKDGFEKESVPADLPVSDLWKRATGADKELKKEIWIEGEALKAHLGIPDLAFRHTVRGLAARPNQFTGEWEVLLLVEKGDQKSGGKANTMSGKPPAYGCPGGTVEDNKKNIEAGETIERALCRETEHEAQCRKVVRIIAKVAEIKKQPFPNSPRINYDHWFYIEVDPEAGMSRNLVETPEIIPDSMRWVPLSELVNFTFQDKDHPVWNLRVILEKKIMYLGHALNLFRILPRIPGIKLPDNWAGFGENIQKFKQYKRR